MVDFPFYDINWLVLVMDNIFAIMLSQKYNLMSVHSCHLNDILFNLTFVLLEPRGDIFSQVFQGFPHDLLDYIQVSVRGDLASAIDYFFALRINDAKVPPSAIGQTSTPILHRTIATRIAPVPRVEGARNK